MVTEAGLAPQIRFEHTVTGVSYDHAAGEWTVRFTGREPVRARAVVVASGPLANPSLPEIDGIDTYQGTKIHSACWDHDYEFAGKRVAVVGTGASAVQIVPQLVKTAGSVKVFQRTPGWVLPRVNTRTAGWAQRLYAGAPLAEKAVRSAWFWGHETVALGVVWDSPLTRVVEAASRVNLRHQVKDPWLRRQLTPDYAAGCKRLLMTSDYYPALQADNCKLITWPIARLSPRGIRTVEGIEHQFDAIVFATGFEVSKAGTPFAISGIDGRDLASEWSRGAYAYRSVAVSGYPNLFFTFGPNSGPGHSSALVYMEAQIRYIVEAIDALLRFGWKALDVRPEAQNRYNDTIQRKLASTTWNSGCRSWYLTADGFNATMYPGFATQYVAQLKTLDLSDYKIVAGERQGAPVLTA
jgi:cation diffusion facilitator CzcD-associated flavoprotein CzcO